MPIQSIATSAFIQNNNKVLIGRRALTKKFLPGVWEIPGGRVEDGESISGALAREVKEEMGLDVSVGDTFFTFKWQPNESTITTESVCFATLIDPHQIPNCDPSEISEWKWITEEEVDTFFSQDDWNGQAIRKGFSILTIDTV